MWWPNTWHCKILVKNQFTQGPLYLICLLGKLYSALQKGLVSLWTEPFCVRMVIPYGMVLVQGNLELVTLFPDVITKWVRAIKELSLFQEYTYILWYQWIFLNILISKFNQKKHFKTEVLLLFASLSHHSLLYLETYWINCSLNDVICNHLLMLWNWELELAVCDSLS